MAAEELLRQSGEKMDKAIASMQEEFSMVRTGRASPHLVERIQVEYYGTKMALNQIAGISVPEARMLVISPYDRNAISAIEKAILASDLGINPSNDGSLIRLTFPPLTQERRKELIKVVKERAEEARVAVRNIRRHCVHDMEKLEKEGGMSEDDLRRAEKELQKVTDEKVSEVDRIVGHKEQELLEV